MKQEDMSLWVPVGMSLLGRVIDVDGNPCDDGPELFPEEYYPLEVAPPEASTRLPINRRFETGVRAIDSMLTMGKGQRMGIYSSVGMSKSYLLAAIARNNNADINVFGIIGKRAEALSFLKEDLGEEALKRSVIVFASSDAASRIRAAYVCTSIAEYFRDKGMDVVLIIESFSKIAQAQREIELDEGSLLVHKRYSQSVFEMIPNLIYRSGTNDKGTITAFYSALSDCDDISKPIIDKMNACLDGYIDLSWNPAYPYYPTIDIQASKNRISKMVTGNQTQKAVNLVRELIKKHSDKSNLINAGVYPKRVLPKLYLAVEKQSGIKQFLQQEEDEVCSMSDTLDKLSKLTGIDIPKEEYAESPWEDIIK